MARVNVDPDAWTALRAEALTRRISLAHYIGRLVQREADRIARRDGKKREERSETAARTADPELATGPRSAADVRGLDDLPTNTDWSRYRTDLPDDREIWIPPWEE